MNEVTMLRNKWVTSSGIPNGAIAQDSKIKMNLNMDQKDRLMEAVHLFMEGKLSGDDFDWKFSDIHDLEDPDLPFSILFLLNIKKVNKC